MSDLETLSEVVSKLASVEHSMKDRTPIFVSHEEALFILNSFSSTCPEEVSETEQIIAMQLMAACARLKDGTQPKRRHPELRRIK